MSNISNYRELSIEKLQAKVDENKQELRQLINQQATDPADDVRAKRNLKRDTARMLTVINEKQGDA